MVYQIRGDCMGGQSLSALVNTQHCSLAVFSSTLIANNKRSAAKIKYIFQHVKQAAVFSGSATASQSGQVRSQWLYDGRRLYESVKSSRQRDGRYQSPSSGYGTATDSTHSIFIIPAADVCRPAH